MRKRAEPSQSVFLINGVVYKNIDATTTNSEFKVVDTPATNDVYNDVDTVLPKGIYVDTTLKGNVTLINDVPMVATLKGRVPMVATLKGRVPMLLGEADTNLLEVTADTPGHEDISSTMTDSELVSILGMSHVIHGLCTRV